MPRIASTTLVGWRSWAAACKFSSTESWVNSRLPWKVRAMPNRAMDAAGRAWIARPSSSTAPLSGR